MSPYLAHIVRHLYDQKSCTFTYLSTGGNPVIDLAKLEEAEEDYEFFLLLLSLKPFPFPSPL